MTEPTKSGRSSTGKDGAHQQVHFSEDDGDARASSSVSVSKKSKGKQKEKEHGKDVPSSPDDKREDDENNRNRDSNQGSSNNNIYRPAPINGPNPTHGVSYGTHFSTTASRSVGPAGYINFSANLKNPVNKVQPTINQIPLNTNPNHIIRDPAMADYQFNGPRPAGPSYQPPVPDTTYGPMTHVYRPRFDNGAYFVHGQNQPGNVTYVGPQMGIHPSMVVPTQPGMMYPGIPHNPGMLPQHVVMNGPVVQPGMPGYPVMANGMMMPTPHPAMGFGGVAGGGGGAPPGAPPPGVMIAGNNAPQFPPDISGVGRTSGEVALENAQFAYSNGLYEPQDFKPADDDPSRYYPVREVDGNWTQRNRYTIDNLGDCRWYVSEGGYFYAVRLPN
ncbi:hypothetical protein ACHAQH_002012 [Verticillium albo-atrum]